MARWNMFLMELRSRDWGRILNNLRGILSMDSWNNLQFWEGFSSCRNSFYFWLFPLLKIWANPFLTNFEKNTSFLFPSYRKHSITPLPWEMETITLAIHMTSRPFRLALCTAFLMQPFPFLSPHTCRWCPYLMSLFYQQNKTKNVWKHFVSNCQIF